MNLLILGGTRFVGLHMAQAALDRGWRVSLYHRGQTNPDVLPDAWHLTGDRNDGYPRGQWDAAIDVSGYIPRHAGEAAQAVKAYCYMFVSTVSVYEQTAGKDGPNEESPRVAPPEPPTEEVTGETYGGLKTACEDVVLQHRPDASILRPGLVVGPHDYTNRFDKWARAFRDGGDVSVPPRLDQPLQLIHARDLAEFALALLSSGREGAYNGVGPKAKLGEMFDALATNYPGSTINPTTGAEGPLVLSADGKSDCLFRTSDSKSLGAGLHARSIQQIAQDSKSWI